jgi:hypothetical protein
LLTYSSKRTLSLSNHASQGAPAMIKHLVRNTNHFNAAKKALSGQFIILVRNINHFNIERILTAMQMAGLEINYSLIHNNYL